MHKCSEFERRMQVLCTLYKDYKLSQISTIHIGGYAKYYAVVHSIKNLRKVIVLCKEFNVKYMVVGNCSNILFLDSGYDGVVISLKSLNKVSVSKNNIIVQPGVMLGQVAQIAKQKGLSGLEWSVGIPATVGGAVVMNAGAFDGDVNSVFNYAFVLNVNTNKLQKIKKIEYLAQHHKSVFTNNHNYVIISISLKLAFSNSELVLSKMQEIAAIRSQKQKVGYHSLGSVFCRGNSQYPPAYMIEHSGLKGVCVGGACVSKVHSGYIVNTGDATSDDMLKLIDLIKAKIKQDWGVSLQNEIIIGA